MKINTISIIQKYYPTDSKTYKILITHSELVAKKALQIAKRMNKFNPDYDFIKEAAMLHDIGIFMTYMPEIGCFGEYPYISHGYLGAELLKQEGLPIHALVCERHVGMGLTMDDIEKNNFPLPLRDMMPQSLEEKIICFADKFFSKKEDKLSIEKSISQIKNMISKYGDEKLYIFEEWLILFGEVK